MKKYEGQKRVVIDNVKPQINGGQFPIKRVPGEPVKVKADIYTDGHDEVKSVILYRVKGKNKWQRVPMRFLGNDHWIGQFTPEEQKPYEYTLLGWVDHFSTWQHDLKKKFEANQDIEVELKIGVNLVKEIVKNAQKGYKKPLMHWVKAIEQTDNSGAAINIALEEEIGRIINEHCDHPLAKQYDKILVVWLDRPKALFSSWYEFFPRSTSGRAGKHGTFKDCEKILPHISDMGFDVIYLPPIHPIGESFRKGKDNAITAKPGEPGSPWAIGSKDGGHKTIHRELGTMEDFERLVKKAKEQNLEIALDIAFQCSPDHPYVKDHPEWFKWRPDGTVQYAENPPKKYQDILPINFESEDWKNLWEELKSIFTFWAEKAVRIFRVDNPHTKAFPFWNWLCDELRKEYPDVIFLAEAFTRPRRMERLAKVGFAQSYSYFTWRNTKQDLTVYLNELTGTEMREYFRPNFWPNTPDILPESLQQKPESSFIQRLVLAATLSSNYGIYGPVFEFGVNTPHPQREEYIHNEKYELKDWDWLKETKIKEVIRRINTARNENKALQTTWNIAFAENDNDQVLSYVKWDDKKESLMLMIVNLDHYHLQSGWVKVPLDILEIVPNTNFTVHDQISGNRYSWHHEWNYFELHPAVQPAHVFVISDAQREAHFKGGK